MQNINYLEITSKLPKIGNKMLYFGIDISAYDGVRLLILQKLFLIDGLRKLYQKDKNSAILAIIGKHLIQINCLINSFDFIFDKLVVIKFSKLLDQILPLFEHLGQILKGQNDSELKDILAQIQIYFENKFQSLCFELEIFLYDTHSFYCIKEWKISSSSAYAIRKSIVNLRQEIKAKTALNSNTLSELFVLVNAFYQIFGLTKFEQKLSKITNLVYKIKKSNQKDSKSINKELNKKLKKFDKKLAKISKKLKPYYQKEI